MFLYSLMIRCVLSTLDLTILKLFSLFSRWVRAIEVYDRVIKIVSPKKAKLAEAETELARQMDKLNEKRTQLQQVTDKLQVCQFKSYSSPFNTSKVQTICCLICLVPGSNWSLEFTLHIS